MMISATLSSAFLLLQEAAPPQDPPLLYPMYMLIIGAGLGAAAQRTVLRNLSPWLAMLAGIVGSAIGGYLGIAALGHGSIALSGGLIGAVIALAAARIAKQSRTRPEDAKPSAGLNVIGGTAIAHRQRTTVNQDERPTELADPAPSTRPQAPHSSSGAIFISYASADRSFAQTLAKALRDEGWSVWWDRVIPPGKTFDAVIEEALDGAKCVVVLWSKSSVASDWVKVEAAEAARRRILIPALIDAATIPLEFRRIQAASLIDWSGSIDHAGFQSLTTSVRELLSATS